MIIDRSIVKTSNPGLVFVLCSRGNRYIKWRMICVFIEPGLDVFTIERSIIMTKYLFSKLSVISFYILCCMRNHNRVTIALFFFLFAEQTTAVENTGHSTSRCFHSEPQENRLQLSSLSSSLLQLLLLRSGDIESNPGPTPNYEIKIIHLNARSIPKHISDIETECNKYDIITCSETWLAPHHTSAQTDLLHFHPPIRLDRPLNHSGGGVAIYVKRHLFCKHRPDLHVPGLEAVWIETKINKETILIGSFYRQTSATVGI